MIDLYTNKIDLKKRYLYYKDRINEVIYPETEFNKLNYMDLKAYKKLTNAEIIKKIRTKMLNQKYNHSLRVAEIIENLNTIIGTNSEIKELSMASGLLHDYGRFIQSVYHNNFYEAEEFYKKNGYNGHGEIGAHLLFELKDINNFHIDEKYYEYIEPVIKYHQINKLQGKLNLKFYKETKDKWEIISGMIHLVKDADMYDILYQRLNGEYPIFGRFYYMNVNNKTLDEISEITGIDKEKIKEINKITDLKNVEMIKLPFKDVNVQALRVPEEFEEKFYNKVYITNPSEWDLHKLQNDKTLNYNSITAMWWTIGQFLGSINFTATLELIKQQQILEKIYKLYPDIYKPLVSDMFEFASLELIDKRIEQGNIYTKTL